MNKIITVYKPKGPTSYDIIRLVKKIVPKEKVGHAGTLDPLASGVLVIGIGKEATKKLTDLIADEKEYLAVVRLGQISQTDDAEGPIKKRIVLRRPNKNQINRVINNFIGKIQQIPPIFSAIKTKGQPAYKLARLGRAIKLEPRQVIIKSIEIIDYRWPDLRIRTITGPGVYIRALARDIGQELKTGAYLADLERVRVGCFIREKALTIDCLPQALLINV